MTVDSEDGAQASGQPYLLDAQRARRFLRELRDRPFIAIVTEGDRVRIYSKGMDVDAVTRTIRGVIDTLDNDEENSGA